MDDFNLDLSEVNKAEELEAQKAEAAVTEDGLDKKHKVAFYVILGIVGLSGLGVPILAYFLVKKIKENKQLKAELDAKNGDGKPDENAEEKIEEKKEESKTDEKPSEKK